MYVYKKAQTASPVTAWSDTKNAFPEYININVVAVIISVTLVSSYNNYKVIIIIKYNNTHI